MLSNQELKELVEHLYADLTHENKTGERCPNPDHWPPEDLAEALMRKYQYLFIDVETE